MSSWVRVKTLIDKWWYGWKTYQVRRVGGWIPHWEESWWEVSMELLTMLRKQCGLWQCENGIWRDIEWKFKGSISRGHTRSALGSLNVRWSWWETWGCCRRQRLLGGVNGNESKFLEYLLVDSWEVPLMGVVETQQWGEMWGWWKEDYCNVDSWTGTKFELRTGHVISGHCWLQRLLNVMCSMDLFELNSLLPPPSTHIKRWDWQLSTHMLSKSTPATVTGITT